MRHVIKLCINNCVPAANVSRGGHDSLMSHIACLSGRIFTDFDMVQKRPPQISCGIQFIRLNCTAHDVALPVLFTAKLFSDVVASTVVEVVPVVERS